MLSSPHKIRFGEPLRGARVRAGSETYVSEAALQAEGENRYRAGYEAGHRALSEELMRQRGQVLEIQNNILRAIERALPTVAAQCEKELLALALQVARRAVHEMPISAELIEATLRAGLAELQSATEYQVRLNPEDHALLQSIQSQLLPPPGSSKVSFAADPAIARAGCVIQTRHGAVELNREKVFQKMEAAALC